MVTAVPGVTERERTDRAAVRRPHRPMRRHPARMAAVSAVMTIAALLSTAGVHGAAAATPRRAADPLASTAMRSTLAARAGSVTAAVEDLRTGQTWVENPRARDQTASIIKADILQTLLRQAEVRQRPLDGADPAVIER